ncbi:metallophosphoesterase [Infirmifilum sp. NZ]|uniref:metallophosphoesterase n=1 Tax=Infirmifilum sp. NZ TaxID=2926850 RepID=UPI0027A2130B|nr:metallophosphoesterase [Infirmifilum sp. NZ]UNQ74286.1 metallophosphoesterase [Infirmifilum sp. NZ]
MPDYSRILEEFIRKPGVLPESLLLELIDDVKGILRSESQLLVVEEDDVFFVGDTHGDVESTVNALRSDAKVKVFLGDYVDRGPYQIENIELLLLAKASTPDRVFLLRGNHETREMNMEYGFYSTVAMTYGYATYRDFEELFSYLSLAAVVNGEIFAVHGGIAKGLTKPAQVLSIPRGQLNDVAFQMLWNDPSEDVDDFAPSIRGWGVYVFGRGPVERFLQESGLKLIVRAHEPFPEGYRWFFDGKLLSIFSCRFYPIEKPVGARMRRKGVEVESLL